MTKDEIRERVNGSQQRWRHRKTGRVVRVVSLVGMNYDWLRLEAVDGSRGSKKLTDAFFKEYEQVGDNHAKD